ncbi:RNA pyrophosphohydrolase [Roseibium aquae]|uniref:RNA pyrophosphohydrolase n=1 Tax=Roseibium aquae TaxID=1323746 RepID=A0A916WZU0_9HYPH|nr:RNA pyrophosphohydrolase [Roseibium aquae]GGB46463.1 RNA pyrophosphohydrolase [Roseibium aquae]
MKTDTRLPGFPSVSDGLPYRPCVGIMLLNADGRVWIGRRDDGSGLSNYTFAWQMPQGGIDDGESAQEAAFRELYEETSIRSVSIIEEADQWFTYDYPPEVVRKTRKGKYRGQAQRWFALRFEGSDEEINILSPPDGHKAEFNDWKWEHADRLPGLIVPFKRPVYEQVVSTFSHLTA